MPLLNSRTDVLRHKTTALFLGGVGLGSIGLTSAIIVSTLAAEAITKTPTFSGIPSAFSILGTALGTTLLAETMRKLGRRNGLVYGYLLAVAGAVTAVCAIYSNSLLLLIVGMFTIGIGRSGDALSRYLVADLYPLDRRATMIGWMVWVGTIGAVIGPNSMGPSGIVAERLGLPTLSGAFLITLLAYGLVAAGYTIFMRPDPSTLVQGEDLTKTPRAPAGLSHLLRLPTVRLALAVLIIGHVVMVLIMTMTPLHLRNAAHGLDTIGFVMSSHIIGMFVFSPLTGRLVDRWGRLPVIVVGQGVLLISVISAFLAPSTHVGLVALALFLLGLGWNLGFVAGSALLSSGSAIEDRTRLQGVTDSFVWSSAAVASATSGLVMSSLGYKALCVIGIALLGIPATALMRYRGAWSDRPRRKLGHGSNSPL